MMVDVTYQMVLSTLQTAGLLVGIFYYIMTLNYTRKNQEQTHKTRSATFYNNIAGQLLSNNEAIKHIGIIQDNPISSVEEYYELWEQNLEYRIAVTWWWNFYETIGDYLREDIIDIGMFAGRHTWFNIWFWEMYKDVIYDHRKRFGPTFFSNMEYLMNALQKYLEEHPELAT